MVGLRSCNSTLREGESDWKTKREGQTEKVYAEREGEGQRSNYLTWSTKTLNKHEPHMLGSSQVVLTFCWLRVDEFRIAIAVVIVIVIVIVIVKVVVVIVAVVAGVIMFYWILGYHRTLNKSTKYETNWGSHVGFIFVEFANIQLSLETYWKRDKIWIRPGSLKANLASYSNVSDYILLDRLLRTTAQVNNVWSQSASKPPGRIHICWVCQYWIINRKS